MIAFALCSYFFFFFICQVRFVKIHRTVLSLLLSQNFKVPDADLIYDSRDPGCWLMAADYNSTVYMAAGLTKCCVFAGLSLGNLTRTHIQMPVDSIAVYRTVVCCKIYCLTE